VHGTSENRLSKRGGKWWRGGKKGNERSVPGGVPGTGDGSVENSGNQSAVQGVENRGLSGERKQWGKKKKRRIRRKLERRGECEHVKKNFSVKKKGGGGAKGKWEENRLSGGGERRVDKGEEGEARLSSKNGKGKAYLKERVNWGAKWECGKKGGELLEERRTEKNLGDR